MIRSLALARSVSPDTRRQDVVAFHAPLAENSRGLAPTQIVEVWTAQIAPAPNS